MGEISKRTSKTKKEIRRVLRLEDEKEGMHNIFVSQQPLH